MVKNISKLSYLLVFSILMASCTKYKEIAYFQDIPSTDSQMYKGGTVRPRSLFNSLTVQPGDILQISVTTLVPTSITGLSSTTTGSSSDASSAAGSSDGATSSVIPGYKVDNSGEIELPLVGDLKVSGKTLHEIQDLVKQKAATYYKDPIVNVRLANFKVTVLGAVAAPGTYIMDQEKSNILDAIGRAGDLSITGKRTNVLLARDEGGKEKFIRLNMNSSNIFDSPYFYLKPGDVVYVQPSRGAASVNNVGAYRTLTVFTTVISLILVITSRIK